MSPPSNDGLATVARSENSRSSEHAKVTRFAAYTDAGPTATATNPPNAGPMIEAVV